MRIRVMSLSMMICLFLLLCPAPLVAEIIQVPDDVATIQGAIDVAAAGDIVEVADGVWTGEGNYELDFGGKAITVRSASGPENYTIDCDGTLYSDEHRGSFSRAARGAAAVR